jgi:hypothetical protein
MSAGHRQIASLFSATGENNRIEFALQLRWTQPFMAPIINDAKIDILANEHTSAKFNAFLLHLRNPAIDMNFF